MKAHTRLLTLAACLFVTSPAVATTYQVGPGRLYTQISSVAGLLNPGDVVEVDGGATFGGVHLTRSGTSGQPITIRGMASGLSRPVVNAVGAADAFRMDVSHYVIEDLVISNAINRCVYLRGTNLTLRRVLVHTCRDHGILGSDTLTGDMTLTEVEVYNSGNPANPLTTHHPIYIATDHALYPNAVLRIERSWIHDNHSGNAIKSRARNVKVFYNWIETTNAQNHTVELIGPDPDGAVGALCPVPNGSNAELLCNGEIVGNVLIARGNNANMVRLGGDGQGNSYGRYHVVNNTFIANATFNSSSSAMIRAFGNIDSVELHNNIFWLQNGDTTAIRIVRDAEASWVSGRRVTGRRNMVTGSSSAYASGIPAAAIAGLTETIFVATSVPIFNALNLATPGTIDLRLQASSPARLAGHSASTSTSGYQIPMPTNLPAFEPPRMRPDPGTFASSARPAATNDAGQVIPSSVGLGAFEYAVQPASITFPDFNADNKPDLIWRNSSGAAYVWYMNGTSLISDAFIASIDPSWKIEGVADFNGDGHPDLVWRNGAGNTYVWYMNGPTFVSDAFLFSLPPEWVIQGVADFNADGKPDFLMRNTASGNAFAWYFNNNVAIGDQYLFNIDPSWKVEGVADLNADGQPDLLFRNVVSGLAFAWNSQYTASTLSLTTSSPPIFSIDAAWEVVQVADWNADGKPDLVFRNKNSGVVFVWYMDGITLTTSDFIIQIDPSWEIVPRR